MSAFDKIAENKVLQQNLKKTGSYFSKLLKKHPSVTSLIRTNSKGKVVNEVVRGIKVPRNFRKVDRQKWYKEVSGKLMPYQGHIKMKSGRYYLMWCNPILAADTVPGNVIDTGLAASTNITDSAQAPAKEQAGTIIG